MATTNQNDQRDQANTGNKSTDKATQTQSGQTTPKKTDANNPKAAEKTERTTGQEKQKDATGKPYSTNVGKEKTNSYGSTDTDLQEKDIEGDREEETADVTNENKRSTAETAKNTNQNTQRGSL